MDQDGAWNLFFATGLPQAYLASLEPDPDGSTNADLTEEEPDPQ